MSAAADILVYFDQQFAARLNHRAASWRVVFEAMAASGIARPILVETGCLREPDNWAGDGQSTIVLGYLAQALGGTLWSVDVSARSVIVARALVPASAQLVLGDSIAFLSRFPAPIDLLYLDSLDAQGDDTPSAQHHLTELEAALPRLHSGSIVLVDDSPVSSGRITGKGRLVAERMTELGATLIAEGYQRAWRMP